MPITVTDDTLHGAPRIEGTRISVLDVYRHTTEFDFTPEEVAEKFNVSLAEVHEALAYYYRHPEQMQRQQEQRENAHQKAKQESPEP